MKYLISIVLSLVCVSAMAQTYEVKDTVMTTYAFSDPNPIPDPDGIYPYYKFESFGFRPVQQTWKMVVLENDYLRVKIFPEVGGKVWSVYDKKQGKEMFYDNKVMKFREIALRGPWTSGGIEFNYGVIGHAPSCAAPVDYKVEKKADGSVSCYIGVQELLTETRWMVEINLPADAVWVRTTSFWHNYSGTFQPYYSWANSAVTATDDLHIIYPGTYSLGHWGEITPYPIDEKGRDLSVYANQAFGADKSYHLMGSHKSYFGAYWADDDFGMLHYSLRDEKLGRKYYTWAQSEQGNIWVDLLTDDNPQYVELQSGRLFNQNFIQSTKTSPFKQFLFTPYGTDKWNEYWLPFSQIGNVDDMNLYAAVNVEQEGNEFVLNIYPVRGLEGKLVLKDASGGMLAEKDVAMKAAEAASYSFDLAAGAAPAVAMVGGKRIWSSDSQEIDRPYRTNEDFSLESAQGQMLMAASYMGMRKYSDAEKAADNALDMDPAMMSALNLKAMLCLRGERLQEAYDYSAAVLAIDAYDPEANYVNGLAAKHLGKVYDAMDRFEIAAITSELRSAACMELARIHFSLGDNELAADYAEKSLAGNVQNVSALELLYQISPSEDILGRIESLDPLCHFPDAERMLAGQMTAEEFDASINEEMKWQNYLDLAIMYHGLGLDSKAVAMLDASADKNALMELWKAYIGKDVEAVSAAEAASMDMVFPFRGESLAPLTWAVENGGGWQSRYLLALLYDFLGNEAEALSLVASDESDYAPYYAYRCSLGKKMEDMAKAFELDPSQWRYRQRLALMHYNAGDYDKAIELTEKYYESHKENFQIGDAYVKSLIAAGQYEKADKILCSMQILPFEGQSGSHTMYRDIKLHLAVKAIDRGRYKEALKRIGESREWPSNLGVGKPYDELIDNKLEDWLSAIVYHRLGDTAKAAGYLDKFSSDAHLKKAYNDAVAKTGGRYPAVSPLLSNLEASDKKLF